MTELYTFIYTMYRPPQSQRVHSSQQHVSSSQSSAVVQQQWSQWSTQFRKRFTPRNHQLFRLFTITPRLQKKT